LVGYEKLQVKVPAPEPTAQEIQAQIDRLRGNFAELAVVPREARTGDSVVIDMSATRDGSPVAGMTYTDYSVELGAGNDLAELDEHLPGAKAGETVNFDAEVGGTLAQVAVLVKEVQEKVLPEETDEWASEASEFSSMDELREDTVTRLSEIKRVQAMISLRDATLRGLAGLVEEEPPTVLVDVEVRRLADELGNRLDAQGIPLQRYLDALGRSVEQLIAELREEAVPGVKVDLALRAVADAVGIEPSEHDMDEFMERLAGQAGVNASAFKEQVQRTGRRAAVRSDLRKSKAFDWVVEHADVTDEEGNPVNRALLTREGQGAGTGTGAAGPRAEVSGSGNLGHEASTGPGGAE
jgi:trigger factor